MRILNYEAQPQIFRVPAAGCTLAAPKSSRQDAGAPRRSPQFPHCGDDVLGGHAERLHHLIGRGTDAEAINS